MPIFSPFGYQWTKTFNDIWETPESFMEDYQASGLYDENNKISDDHVRLIFCLLTARYGASSIKTFDEGLFKYRVFSIIFSKGPAWEANLIIQQQMRDLLKPENIGEIFVGTKQIFSEASTPGQIIPDTDELPGIDSQKSSRVKRGKIEGLEYLSIVLKSDVTTSFIREFENLFVTFATPPIPALYATETVDLEEDV